MNLLNRLLYRWRNISAAKQERIRWHQRFTALVMTLHLAQWQTEEELVTTAIDCMMAEAGVRSVDAVPFRLLKRYHTDALRLSTRNVDDIVASWRRYAEHG